MFKLRAVFGEQENLREFILKYPELRPRELMEIYATENNITPEEFQFKRDQMRKAKLAAFYDCPEEEFNEIVKAHPNIGFRDTILKLKETGVRTYTGENFKKMRQKFRKCEVEEERSEEKNSIKRERKHFSKPKEMKRSKDSRDKRSDKLVRRNLLETMK